MPASVFDAALFEQPQHLRAKQVGSHHADGANAAHAQVGQVSHHVARAAQAVALRAHAPHRQPGLN